MQKNYGVKFLSFGSALPEQVVKNTDLEKLFDTSDEWIYTRTGIKQRNIISSDESGLTLSLKASKEALSKTKLDPKDIDLIIVATSTPDKLYPSMGCMLQGKLGAVNACAFDISAACSGFIFGIVSAAQFIYSGEYKNILVVGVDVHSRFIDWSERSVAVLFGDGAGAVLMSSCLARDDQILGYSIHSEADKNLDLILENSNISYSNFKKQIEPDFVRMNGKAIYQFAVRVVPEVVAKLLDKTGLKQSQIDYLVLHQANQRIIDYVANKLSFNNSQIISNIEKVGNTSAASIPLAIVSGLSEKKIKTPCKMMLVGFGAGLTWGAIAVDYY
ncbi:MAG: ketoacyl-ACP synthase III [Candidatus Melainabacteria bacterium]|nr:ketoacyl-ACP synthase III [Candidatus Melainabacteria bacterium]